MLEGDIDGHPAVVTADTATTPSTRRRATGALLLGVVLMNLSMVPTTTVASLVVSDRVGAAWSGLPSAAGVLGTAFSAVSLSTLMRTRGRRAGLLLGYAVAVVGALVAALAVMRGVMPLFVAAMALLGMGNASAQLSRYAAADLFPAERRASALGIVVWGGTIGALVGPSLIAPAAELADDAGLPADAGTYLLAVVTTVTAAAVVSALPRTHLAGTGARGRSSWTRLDAALRTPTVTLAVTAMVTAQLVMVAVMTMTPLQLHAHGHGLDVVGWILSAHLAGMFALSPVTGRLTDRFGARTTNRWWHRPAHRGQRPGVRRADLPHHRVACGAVPARLRLEPLLRRWQRPTQRRPPRVRPVRAPGRRRRLGLGFVRLGQSGRRSDLRRRRLHQTRAGGCSARGDTARTALDATSDRTLAWIAPRLARPSGHG